MSLFTKKKREADSDIIAARVQVDVAIANLEKALDDVEEQTLAAREVFDERRAGRENS